MDGFIYHWTNNINGKRYVGRHEGSIDDGYIGSGVAFTRAIKKYGIENFTRTILEECSSEMLKDREQYYLDLYNAAYDDNFYNIAPEASSGWRHVNEDPSNVNKILETKRKNGTINTKGSRFKNRRHTDATKKQMSVS